MRIELNFFFSNMIDDFLSFEFYNILRQNHASFAKSPDTMVNVFISRSFRWISSSRYHHNDFFMRQV